MANYRDGYLEILNSGKPVYEIDLLKMMLSNAFGGKDLSAVAEALLERFPGISAIIEAEIEEILAVEGVTERMAVYFKTLKLLKAFTEKQPLHIKTTEDFYRIIEKRFDCKDVEIVETYFVNKNGKVTDIRTYSSRDAGKVEVTATDILSAISTSKAYGLYFAHNHVSCPATPSRADDETTIKIMRACDMCKIKFFDHCIINTAGEKFSYSLSGRLKELQK